MDLNHLLVLASFHPEGDRNAVAMATGRVSRGSRSFGRTVFITATATRTRSGEELLNHMATQECLRRGN